MDIELLKEISLVIHREFPNMDVARIIRIAVELIAAFNEHAQHEVKLDQ